MALLKFPTHRESTRTQEERRESLEFGKLGEQIAARYLTDQGYIILEPKTPYSLAPSISSFWTCLERFITV